MTKGKQLTAERVELSQKCADLGQQLRVAQEHAAQIERTLRAELDDAKKARAGAVVACIFYFWALTALLVPRAPARRGARG